MITVASIFFRSWGFSWVKKVQTRFFVIVLRSTAAIFAQLVFVC
jgi:hypothetical protein